MPVSRKASAPAAPNRPDWRRAAKLLAQGDTVTAVARQIGCSRSQLSHQRNHDPLFQSRIAAFQQTESCPDDRLPQLPDAVHRAIENEVRRGSARVVLWLAGRLKLVTPPTEATSGQELQNLLDALSPAELREFESLSEPES